MKAYVAVGYTRLFQRRHDDAVAAGEKAIALGPSSRRRLSYGRYDFTAMLAISEKLPSMKSSRSGSVHLAAMNRGSTRRGRGFTSAILLPQETLPHGS